MKRKISSISIKRKKQEIERRSDHIGGSSSSCSGKGRRVPLLTYILKAVAMHGDMGDGDDSPPPPAPTTAAVLLLLMMMMMALATAPLFKLSAAADQQPEQSQRAARNFYCPLLLATATVITRSNTTEYQQKIDRPSTEHQQNFDGASTELRPSINRTYQQNINRKSLKQVFALGFFIHPPQSLLTSASCNLGVFFFWGTLVFFFPSRLQHTTEYQQNINSSWIIRVSFIHHTPLSSSSLHHLSI